MVKVLCFVQILLIKKMANYHIIGTLKPEVFKAQDVEDRIRGICEEIQYSLWIL